MSSASAKPPSAAYDIELSPALPGIRQQDDAMNRDAPRAAVGLARNWILPILVSFSVACFSGALATDIAYAGTANMMWADFSAWLLAAGMLMGVLAAIVGIIGLMAKRRVRSQRPDWSFVIGGLIVLVLAFINNLVHSRDAWTSVVPTGLALSAVTVVVMLITAWLSSAMTKRQAADVQHSGVHP
jgi:uncharacterized membrane protein